MTLLIKRAEQPLQFNPVDLDEDIPPSTWCGPHVGKRMVEAMIVLRSLPSGGGGGSSAWPVYIYEFDDLVAQKEQGELEQTQKLQNRTRVSPSFNEITRMETAIWWPARYLMMLPHLLIAVNAVALAHSLDRPAEWVTKKRGGDPDTWRRRHDQGCDLISDGLIAERVPVF